MIGDIELDGSPFGCEVYDISRISVIGLEEGFVGTPCEFTGKAALCYAPFPCMQVYHALYLN